MALVEEQVLEDWLHYLTHEKRLSVLTVSHYRRDLHALLQFVKESGRTFQTIDAFSIRHFVAKLHGKGLSGRSISRHLSAWRGFFGWLAKKEGLALNPCDGIRPPKSGQRLPKVLSVDDAATLLDVSTDEDDQPLLLCRDKAMFELFYSSGLRLSELQQLNVDILDRVLHDAELRVLGKRGKTRVVPVGDKARNALKTWFSERAQIATQNENALFISQRGTRLSVRMIQLRLQRLAKHAGLLQHVHPHMLRHSVASHFLQSSSDLRAVQEMLGHASLSSTQIYTHLDFQHLSKAYDQAHPRAKRKTDF